MILIPPPPHTHTHSCTPCNFLRPVGASRHNYVHGFVHTYNGILSRLRIAIKHAHVAEGMPCLVRKFHQTMFAP
jgi:hypothetical protein